ncbi:hypothetical protein [Micromonospora endophytica]|uniref:Flavin reductase n=1 Tax=Micromonospora endophytica TaxID=515350 RepID=A0A2W2CBD4_9ACTN|nr:hypothetical protein [Micromonospora endophytica]PZF95842.1 hypothetical protein C1I93_14725 [Micromonospora endophytica]RIW41529.1 hypothetical protein D3H59_25715 [Micromonospora endophytica]
MVTTRLPTPGRGPLPERPRPVGAQAPHTPLRPMWCCRACGQPWPCAPARLLLRAEFDRNRTGLSIYLAGLMYEAMRDLYHLNPHDGPDPKALFARFLAWAAPRRPAADPPGSARHHPPASG